MPSVEMRRSTRVFVPKTKGGELVKVLRSGRRLWVESSTEINHQRSVKNGLHGEDDEWFPLIDESVKCKPSPPPQPPKQRHLNVNEWDEDEAKPDPMDVDEKQAGEEQESTVKSCGGVEKSGSRVIRNVYSRKRKLSPGVCSGRRETKKFGLYFVRRQRRKSVESSVDKDRGCEKERLAEGNDVLSIVSESGCAGCSLVSRLLWAVLNHVGSGRVELGQLSTFLVSSPVANVFASFGIRFLSNHQLVKNRGVCRIFGERQIIPLFIVDFSAIPLCFLGLHASLSLRSLHISSLCWMDSHNEDDSAADDDEPLARTAVQSEQMGGILGAPDKDVRGLKIVVAGLEAGKVGSRNVQHKSSVLTRSSSKRRRRSLRNRRARNPSNFIMQKANGLSVCNHIAFKKNGAQLPLLRDLELRRSARKNSTIDKNVPNSSSSCSVINLQKSSSSSITNVPKSNSSSLINVPKSRSGSAGLNVDIDSQQCCSVNVLVVETDKCYRIEGAEVALELSPSNEWVLAVSKDGMMSYCLKVQKELRPHTTNRFTHAVVLTADNGWKLEFSNRKDWVVFKDLYKLCGDRNVVPTSPVNKIIPVPGVSEVASFWDSTSAFERPESYIRVTSDELSRTLSRRTANYDMDSEDEEWLNKFNTELDEANVLSEETFELSIDAFEKASYYSPEGVSDEKVAASLCLDLGSPDLTVHVYRYWTTKRRKHKRAPLLRVFKENLQKRASLIAKPVLRKKRSLKRTAGIQPLQKGRGKDSSVLQALAVEQTILEEQHAVLRVQEARVSADKSIEVAIQKRQRAQFLMENADLAVYRATMALRIADAATHSVGSQQAAGHFLD